MQFLRENQGKAIQAITARITQELSAGKRVLWLVSGGSNVAPEVEIMTRIKAEYGDRLGQLAVIPIDERYGKRGHAGSNTHMLREAGFDPGGATWIDVLEQNVPFDRAVSFYNDIATTALENAHYVVGQFGMGDNGHVAGVQPRSPAVVSDETTVAGYAWTDYQRMTLTPLALQRVDVGYLLAYGPSKKDALVRLQENAEVVNDLPAALLYEIPEVYVYNDQIESEGKK